MNYKSIAQKIIAEKTIHIIVINIFDDEGVEYVTFMLMKGDALEKFEQDKKSKLKLEKYGIVYCSIPGNSVSEELEGKILERMKQDYFNE